MGGAVVLGKGEAQHADGELPVLRHDGDNGTTLPPASALAIEPARPSGRTRSPQTKRYAQLARIVVDRTGPKPCESPSVDDD